MEPGRRRTVTNDGAWCWFGDPRAIQRPEDGRIHAGWVTRQGNIVVGTLLPWSGELVTARLHQRFEVDDHASPSLSVLPGGGLTVFYCRHSDDRIRLRQSSRPQNPDGWDEERWLKLNASGDLDTYCYPSAVVLPEEDDAVFLFWRGTDLKPCLSLSRDGGNTWAAGRILFSRPGAAADNRPYVKLTGDGRGRIHLAVTDGHPRDEPRNAIRYCYYERGGFFGGGGRQIGSLETLPLDPWELDLVYDGQESGRAWIWDIAPDQDGAAITFAVMPDPGNHAYLYATTREGAWVSSPIVEAGGWFPQTPAGTKEPEPHYSAGVVLNHTDPRTVFLSRRIAGKFEIEGWTTLDHGHSWEHKAVTSKSEVDNVRPVFVRGSDPAAIMWMRLDGGYRHYTEFQTSIQFAVV